MILVRDLPPVIPINWFIEPQEQERMQIKMFNDLFGKPTEEQQISCSSMVDLYESSLGLDLPNNNF